MPLSAESPAPVKKTTRRKSASLGRGAPIGPDDRLRGDELQLGDLRGSSEAHRRAPVASAAAHVDRCALVLVEAGNIRREEGNQIPEREDLTAVRVTGELEVDPE